MFYNNTCLIIKYTVIIKYCLILDIVISCNFLRGKADDKIKSEHYFIIPNNFE